MDKPISMGDLVQIVRYDHACGEVLIGRIFQVAFMPINHPGVYCPKCKQRDIAVAGEPIAGAAPEQGYPMRWLKRIPPLSELEGERRDEEAHA